MLTRRHFSKGLLAGGAALLAPKKIWSASDPANLQGQNAPNAQTPKDLDLVIKGGTVVDPGQNLHSLLDVAVRNGKIAEVSKDIAASRARTVISAKDKIVTPGFIDVHAHCYDGIGRGINADHYCLGRGVTTVVDGGSAGSSMIPNFRKYIINTSLCRIYADVNIDVMGRAYVSSTPRTPTDVLGGMDSQSTARAITQNKPAAVGVKVLLGKAEEGDKDVEALTRALAAGEAAGVPVMAHIVNPVSPLPTLLNMMRKGDVYTHIYNNHPHGILDENGKVLQEARDARQRGLIFDPADGNIHVSFDVAEKCMAQDFPPDTISTDLNTFCLFNGVMDLPTQVSKFLALGMNLDKAIECVTAKPATIYDYGVQIGTLKPGFEADIGIFDLREGNFVFSDSDGKTRNGHQMLVNEIVVCRGQVLKNQG